MHSRKTAQAQEPKEQPRETRRPHVTKAPQPRENTQARKTSSWPEIQWAKAQKTIAHGGSQGGTHGKQHFLEFQRPVWNSKGQT
ncbi:hypothetical protein MA16_Dca018676 [Dendrobium catenatum]|uniref:Uncharacterized protein n=1 Tax=Dendrobium catenatum TaxID=906689 RepID=A0A2I0X1E5_9ASPA|nr:hypothetical protein MA16_Dca018676 [Dendrobium catenatum]